MIFFYTLVNYSNNNSLAGKTHLPHIYHVIGRSAFPVLKIKIKIKLFVSFIFVDIHVWEHQNEKRNTQYNRQFSGGF